MNSSTSNKTLAEYIVKVFLITQGTCMLMMMGMVWHLSNANMAEINRSIGNYSEKAISANTIENQRSTDVIIQQHIKTEVLVTKLQKEIEALKVAIDDNKKGVKDLQAEHNR